MDFAEFSAAALSVYQLEARDRWDQHARCAYDYFEKEGNRTILIEELASVCWIFQKYFKMRKHMLVKEKTSSD